jgi:hypothetical protein
VSTLTLEGNIQLGPQGACEGGGAAGLLNLPFGLGSGGCGGGCVSAAAKAYNTKKLSSPTSFVTLPGLGATDVVTKAKFLYLRAASPVKLRLTQVGGTPQTVDVSGLCILQFPPTLELTLLEGQGSADLEYVIVGDL